MLSLTERVHDEDRERHDDEDVDRDGQGGDVGQEGEGGWFMEIGKADREANMVDGKGVGNVNTQDGEESKQSKYVPN